MRIDDALELEPRSIKAKELEIRQPSILFTGDDLNTIKRYVCKAFELKTEKYEIAEALGSNQLALGENLLLAISNLNAKMIEHAKTWPELESQSKQLGLKLEIVSENFVVSVGQIIDFVKRTEAYEKFDGKLDDVKELLPPVQALSENDSKAKPSIMKLIDTMKDRVNEYQVAVAEVYALSKEFADVLEYELPSLLRLVKNEVKEKVLEGHEKEYAEKIEKLKVLIEQKTVEVQQYRASVWWGALFGPLGLGVAYFTVGSEEREADRQRTKYIDDLDHAQSQLSRLDPLKARLEKYELQLLDTKARLDATKAAAEHLNNVWSKIGAQIDDSKVEVDRINNNTDLLLFLNGMTIIRRSWKKTWRQSQALNEVFREFTDVYKQQLNVGAL